MATETSESPVSLLAEGRYRYSSGDYEESIIIYTAAISLNDLRLNAAMDGGGVTINDKLIAAEIKVIQYRSLSSRSEAYLALKKYKDAYTDAKAALALLNNLTTPSSRLSPLDTEWAHDLENRAMAGFLGLDNHLDLDNIQRTKAKCLLENPQQTVRFVPGSRGAIHSDAELLLGNMQDDLSVLTPCTGFPGSTRTMGTTESTRRQMQDDLSMLTPSPGFPGSTRTVGTTETSRRLKLDAIYEHPKSGSPSSQQRFMTSHQIIEPALPQLSTTANSVSPIDVIAPSASVNGASHSLLSAFTATVTKPRVAISKQLQKIHKIDKHEYTQHGPQTKTFSLASGKSTSSTSSYDSSSSCPSDAVNAVESHSSSNASTATQETSMGDALKLNDIRISDETSNMSLSSQQSSTCPHQSGEPSDSHASDAPAHDTESYMSTSPKLEVIVELYENSISIGSDGEAINALKMALFQGNGTTRSKELAMFCLTKLLELTRKSDENKKLIISDGKLSAFNAITETARFHQSSVEIQQEVCGLLWALCVSVDLPALSTKFKEHVALDSACISILNATLMHVKIDTLQVKALGALKILSFHNACKSILRSQGGILIVANSMLCHTCNLPIQSKGCVILDNLTKDESSQSAKFVSENVVNALLEGMHKHPRSLDVHKAACSTLMNIASSDENVALIRRNIMTIESLKLAVEWHPHDVEDEVSALRERLNMNDRRNFDEDNNRHTLIRRLRLPTLAPQFGFGRRSFGIRKTSLHSDSESGDLS